MVGSGTSVLSEDGRINHHCLPLLLSVTSVTSRKALTVRMNVCNKSKWHSEWGQGGEVVGPAYLLPRKKPKK